MEPKLIESGTKYFYREWLSRYHQKRMTTYSMFVNIGLFLVFIGVFGGWLVWRYHTRPSPEDLKKKEQEKQKYLTDRISQIQQGKEKTETQERLQRAGGYIEPELAHSSSNLITELPQYENEFHLVHGLKTI